MMALEGIRILDLSRLAPGPYCTMLLADMGADVLVIEQPPSTEGRHLFSRQPDPRAVAYNALGRNKRSVGLNLKEQEARQIFYNLAKTADVVLEGFRPGVVKRLGVDYETISGINPRIVYLSLSGYGQDGPYAALVGHDINYISIGGALGMIGRPGTPPALPLNIIADFAAGGLHAAYAILVGLLARERTGRGQYIDLAMSDGVTYLLAAAGSQYFSSGVVPLPGKHVFTGAAPHFNAYETKDGKWISIGSMEPWFFENLCQALECEHFIPQQNNTEKWPEMYAYFQEKFKTKTRDEWFDLLSQTDICVAPVYTLDEVFQDPHVRHRQMVVEVDHPELGKVKHVGIGPKFSETPGSVRSTAPMPGQHTDEVLRSLGYRHEDISRLRETGVVA